MPRRLKLSRAQKQRRQEERERQQREDVIKDTAAVFSCATETAADFAYQCESNVDGVDSDILFNRVAVEIWHEQPGHTQKLARLLADLLAERERHRQVLAELGKHLRTFAAEDTHEHLDPPEALRDLIRQRVFPPEPAQ